MNYGELKTQVANYMHRSDLTSQIEFFVEQARTAINRDLRCSEQIAITTIIPTDARTALPSDYLAMREVSRPNTSGIGRYALNSVGRHELSAYVDITGSPSLYSVDGLDIEIAPDPVGTDFQLIYYAADPAFTNDMDERATLSRYPSLWLYASLVEGFSYIQDDVNMAKAENRYTNEILNINRESRRAELGENLQMTGASKVI